MVFVANECGFLRWGRRRGKSSSVRCQHGGRGWGSTTSGRRRLDVGVSTFRRAEFVCNLREHQTQLGAVEEERHQRPPEEVVEEHQRLVEAGERHQKPEEAVVQRQKPPEEEAEVQQCQRLLVVEEVQQCRRLVAVEEHSKLPGPVQRWR